MLGTQYGLTELLITSKNLILSKILFPGSRLIRRPFYLRNKKNLNWGNGLTIGYGCRFDLYGESGITLEFGDNCKLNDRVHIVAHESVNIGNNVLMASNIFISDTSHGDYADSLQEGPEVTPDDRRIITSPVRICDNVWIGEGVCILPGVCIGKGSIIGSNAVVTKSIPDNSIAVGSPAKVVKTWNEVNRSWEKVK